MVSLRLVTLAVALASGLPVAAIAQTASDETVVSASHATALPAANGAAKPTTVAEAVKPSVSQAQTVAWLAAASKGAQSDSAAAPADPAPLKGMNAWGRTIHGSAGVSVGTGGYRSAYVTSEIPVGETGTLGLAYSQTDFGKNNVYYPRGYGYGYGGYGYGYGRRGGQMQSFGVSLDMSDDARDTADADDDCAPGFYDDGRYVEPVWVTQMHGNASCEAAGRH